MSVYTIAYHSGRCVTMFGLSGSRFFPIDETRRFRIERSCAMSRRAEIAKKGLDPIEGKVWSRCLAL